MLWIINLVAPIIENPLIFGILGGLGLFFWLSFQKMEREILAGISAFIMAVGLFWLGAWFLLTWFTAFNAKTPFTKSQPKISLWQTRKTGVGRISFTTNNSTIARACFNWKICGQSPIISMSAAPLVSLQPHCCRRRIKTNIGAISLFALIINI